MAHLLGKIVGAGQDLIQDVGDHVWGKRTFSIYITNATGQVATISGKPLAKSGTCTHSFTELAPGDAGSIRFWSEGLEGGIGGGVSLVVGDEKIVFGVSIPKFCENNCLAAAFNDTSTNDFYNAMSTGFVLGIGDSSYISGDAYGANVSTVLHEYSGESQVLLCMAKDLPGLRWMPIHKGMRIPDTAVMAGETKTDGVVYAGRFQGEAGKIGEYNGKMQYFYGHSTNKRDAVEILVASQEVSTEWISIKKGERIPDGAVEAGVTASDGAICVGRFDGEAGKINKDGLDMWNFWGHHCGQKETAEVLVAKPLQDTTSDTVSSVRALREIFDMESSQQLAFLESLHQKGSPSLGSALLIVEYCAIKQALAETKSISEQAFTQDLLIEAFIANGAVCSIPVEELGSLFVQWKESMNLFGDYPGGPLEFQNYLDVGTKLDEEVIERHIDTGKCVLLAACMHSAAAVKTEIASLMQNASWPPALYGVSVPKFSPAARTSVDSSVDDNEAYQFRHLNEAPDADADSSSRGPSKDADAENDGRLRSVVRFCIQLSGEFRIRRGRIIGELLKACGANASVALDQYRKWLPLSSRRYTAPAAEGLPEFRFQTFSDEVFENLGAEATLPELVLKSLGTAADEMKRMDTNSKSGEFFFFSSNRRFLVKTVTDAEGELLARMLPSYQSHLRRYPQSLIVRYAGLIRYESHVFGTKYFTVMASVFDPEYKIHECFDLKGSFHKRQKKEGESTGKDMDWKTAGHRLQLLEKVCRTFLANHERDAAFLMRAGVMDYSVLVGIHRPEETSSECKTAMDWCGPGIGVMAEDSKVLYFIGMIDFLIFFSAKKKAEHIFNVAKGHGEDASCVDPRAYAERQVEFVRKEVLPCQANVVAPGNKGLLQVHFVSASNLRNADGLGILNKSDPYAVATLGLQSARTPHVDNDLNPKWDCHLTLPVHDHHLSGVVELSVWDYDQDYKHLQGEDDSLGKVIVPMKLLLESNSKSYEVDQPLTDVSTGQLVAKLALELAESD